MGDPRRGATDRPGAQAPRVLVIVGTRPEVIKMAPVFRALQRRDEVEAKLTLSGQHTDLVRQALDVFSLDLDHDLEADHDLSLMREDQDLYDLAHGMLDGFRRVIRDVDPDVVLVQGDTATVLFGALVSFFERLRVGHVEAGLRSGDKWSPFPEEVFRRLTDVTSDFLFAPTERAADNLRAEGVAEDRIHVTGNTVVDAVRMAAETVREAKDPVLRRLVSDGSRMVLLTAHRRESFGAPIREIFQSVVELAEANPDVDFLYPVHPNPNVMAPAHEILGGVPRVHLVEPLDYLDLVIALRASRIVMTDSGGIQEEAPALATPVLVLRETTERPEGIEAGVAKLVGTSRDRIVPIANRLLQDDGAVAEWERTSNPYGDGRAGERIADIVVSALVGCPRRVDDWSPGGSPEAASPPVVATARGPQ